MAPLNGRMRVVERDTVSTGAFTTGVPIKPLGEDVEWEIIWAIGKQNDGVVSHGWHWYEPETPAGAELYATVGALNVPIPLGAMSNGGPNVSMGPWWATWNRFPSYRFEASGAGKTGKILAIVIEHVGVEGLE